VICRVGWKRGDSGCHHRWSGGFGEPRFTRDIDGLVILEAKRWPGLLETGERHGFEPRLSDALEFAGRSRVLLLRHRSSGVDVDLVFGALAIEEEILRRSVRVKIGFESIPLPTPEDPVIMKAVAGRPQDWLDIESLLVSHPRLNLDRVRQTVGEFASTLDSPEILAEPERMVPQSKRK
jgi:hypothetical protein